MILFFNKPISDDHIVLSALAHCYSQSCNTFFRNTELLIMSICNPHPASFHPSTKSGFVT